MNASIVELRYKMRDILEALARNEEVTVLHRGKARGVIKPLLTKTTRVQDHPFFGSQKPSESVDAVMNRLRAPRTDAF